MNKTLRSLVAILALLLTLVGAQAQIVALNNYDPTLVVDEPFLVPTAVSDPTTFREIPNPIALQKGFTGGDLCLTFHAFTDELVRVKQWQPQYDAAGKRIDRALWPVLDGATSRHYKFRIMPQIGKVKIWHQSESEESGELHSLTGYGIGDANVIVVGFLKMPGYVNYFVKIDGLVDKMGYGMSAVLPTDREFTGMVWMVGYTSEEPELVFRPARLAEFPEWIFDPESLR